MALDSNELLMQREHPLRRALIDELHGRRFPSFTSPARMTQLIMYHGNDDARDNEREHAQALCAQYGVTPPRKGRYFCVRLNELHLVWESHRLLPDRIAS